MGSPAIFKGRVVKFLARAGILIPQRAQTDRSLVPENGELGYNTTTNKLEVYENGSWTYVLPIPPSGNFAFANSQSTPTDVTGFMVSSSLSSRYLVGIYREATSNKYETLDVLVVKKGSTYSASITGVGDDPGVTLSITATGQIQYTSTTAAGHNATNSKIYWKEQVTL